MIELHYSTTTCPDCLSPCKSTDWRPQEGIDPNMREFQCTYEHCKNREKFYKVIRGSRGRETQLNLFGRVL